MLDLLECGDGDPGVPGDGLLRPFIAQAFEHRRESTVWIGSTRHGRTFSRTRHRHHALRPAALTKPHLRGTLAGQRQKSALAPW